jgi:Icc protein
VLIAQVTDIHIGFDPGNPDEHNMVRLKSVLARLAEGPNRPDMLLLTGDLTESGDADCYRRLIDALGVCPFPVWPMVGNHDSREELLAAFPQAPSSGGFVQYAIEGRNLRVLMLDTFEPGRHGGAFCDERAAWLKAELAAHPDTPTLIAMHHPPVAAGIVWMDTDAAEPWVARFADAIAGHLQIVSIICGHVHRTLMTGWKGVPLVICPSIAPAVALNLSPIDAERPDGRDLISDEQAGYALHRWNGENLISHFESVGSLRCLARFDENLQPMIRAMLAERP